MSESTPLQRNVRRLMLEKGITYEAVYRHSGLAQSSLARMLTGTTKPRFSTIEKLASVLGTTPVELLADTDDVPSPVKGKPLSNATITRSQESSLFFDIVNGEYEKDTAPKKKEPPRQDVSTLVRKYHLTKKLFDRLANGEEPDSYVAAPPGTSRQAVENMICFLATNSSMRPSVFEGDLLYCEKVPEDFLRSGNVVLANTSIGPVVGRLFKRNVTHLIKFDDDNSPEVERIEATSIYGVIKWLVRRL